jgi:hypothetical protein
MRILFSGGYLRFTHLRSFGFDQTPCQVSAGSEILHPRTCPTARVPDAVICRFALGARASSTRPVEDAATPLPVCDTLCKQVLA